MQKQLESECRFSLCVCLSLSSISPIATAAAGLSLASAARGSNLSLRDFDAGRAGRQAAVGKEPAADDDAPSAEHPAVLVLGTDDDARRDWLVAGQALGAVLLRATVAGVAAQPVTSVLEVPVLRARLRSALGLVGFPQMVLRAGYGSAGPASHRLPVDRILDVVGA